MQQYNEILQGLRNQRAAGVPIPDAAPPAQAPAAAPAVPAVVPPPAAPATAAPAAPALTAPNGSGPATTTPTEEDLKKLHFRPSDHVEQTLLRMAKETGKPLYDPELIDAARAVHGQPPITRTAAPAPSTSAPSGSPSANGSNGSGTAAPATTDPNAPPATIAEAEARIAELRVQRTEAQNNFLFDDADKLDTRIADLRELKITLAQQAHQQQQQRESQEQTSFHGAWQQNLNKAESLYGAAVSDPDSPLAVRARELQAVEKQKDSDLFRDPRSALIFFQLAAADLNILPQAAPAPNGSAPATTPTGAHSVAPVSPGQPSVVPPASALISQGSAPPTRSPTEAKVPEFKSTAEFHRWAAEQKGTGRSYAVPSFVAQ